MVAVAAGLTVTSGQSERQPVDAGEPLAIDLRLLLVVVDGLRNDEAADATTMPFLAALPNRQTARVECALPSSTAAITTWTTGRVPTLRSFLFDFDSRERTDGGLFADLSDADRPAFVSGPTLWTGRFGRWVDGFGDDGWGATDESRTRYAAAALSDGRAGLVILHLDNLDRVAHRGGNIRNAQTAIDGQVRMVAGLLRSGDRLLVTSDHGRTASGGHAGCEPDVLATPVLSNRPLPPVGTQRDVAAFLRSAFGLVPASPVAVPAGIAPIAVAFLLLAGLAIGWTEPTARRGAIVAWCSGGAFIFLLLGQPVGTFAAATVALVAMASGCSLERPVWRWLIVGGGLLAMCRLWLPTLPPIGVGGFVAGTTIATAAVWLSHRWWTRHPLAILVVVAAAAWLQGQGPSLSTVQTTIGFATMEWGGPLAGVVVTTLLHAIPIATAGACSMAGWDRMDGLAAAFVGAIAAMLASGVTEWQPIPAAADQLILRMLCEAAVFGIGGGVGLLGRVRLLVRVPRLRRSVLR